ncbi:MAG TPA: ABC transporter ATP-binding protein [Vicinamibacterales bacterium]|nr:ABC transporter ATP-binding protein [Vicinamibacterales bacterium]
MTTTARDVLTVSGARKRFGDTVALDGAGFSLRQGELLALLGPNGAGKTTLIRAISGRVKLDAGEIRLFGESVDAAGRRSRTSPELGIVPQEIAVYPLLTPRENLEAFGRLQGLRGRDLAERVAWALSLASLEDRATEVVKGFSGGMKRRLNIACGVLHRPRVVLLDEPTVGVDPQSRERIYDMLSSLTDDGVSILLTTHHLEEAEARCTRTVIIDHGRVIASGTLSDLVDQTVGRHRIVVVRTDAPVVPPPGVDADADDPRVLRVRVTDVARELPAILGTLAASGRSIDDVEVKAPSLQSVFIHLTGRELRE